MLDYLVTSKTRRRLLRHLWVECREASVSELAELASVSFGAAHKELSQMHAAGLADRKTRGNKTVFKAREDSANADVLRGLLAAPSSTQGTETQTDPQTRSWLGAWGAPLVAAGAPGDVPDVETALARGAELARSDASVARSLPVVVWKNRNVFDARRLRAAAARVGTRHTLGFFLELTGVLGRDEALVRQSRRFRDGRRRADQDFFVGNQSATARRLADLRTPALAKAWHFRMNMDMDTFASTFRKFTTDEEV